MFFLVVDYSRHQSHLLIYFAILDFVCRQPLSCAVMEQNLKLSVSVIQGGGLTLLPKLLYIFFNNKQTIKSIVCKESVSGFKKCQRTKSTICQVFLVVYESTQCEIFWQNGVHQIQAKSLKNPVKDFIFFIAVADQKRTALLKKYVLHGYFITILLKV